MSDVERWMFDCESSSLCSLCVPTEFACLLAVAAILLIAWGISIDSFDVRAKAGNVLGELISTCCISSLFSLDLVSKRLNNTGRHSTFFFLLPGITDFEQIIRESQTGESKRGLAVSPLLRHLHLAGPCNRRSLCTQSRRRPSVASPGSVHSTTTLFASGAALQAWSDPRSASRAKCTCSNSGPAECRVSKKKSNFSRLVFVIR